MKIIRVVSALVLAGATIAPISRAYAATIDTAELERCAAITASSDRLACYDALASAVHSQTYATQPSAVAPQPSAPGAPAAPPVAVQPAQQSATPAQQQSGFGLRPAPAQSPAEFGLPPALPPVLPAGTDQLKAIVDKVIEDRYGNMSIVLENGQTWAFMEQGVQLRPGELVTIKKAALGSYLLTTRNKRSYRIRRLQ